MIQNYIESAGVGEETRSKLLGYLSFVSKRASGELLTNASWIRQFVAQHPDYHHDSIVGESVAYDLCSEPSLLGE